MNAGVLRLRATAMTHQGRVRANNEDHVAIGDWVRGSPMASPLSIECLLDEPRLCVVADGLGGQASGEVASELAVRFLSKSSSRLTSAEELIAVLQEANDVIYRAMEEVPERSTMGATVVGIAASGSNAWLFNLGDSRGYLWDRSQLRLLSTDDNTVANLQDSSQRTGQFRGSITQALGGAPFRVTIRPHIVAKELEPGDRYLLCSDGLTDMLDRATIESCLGPDPIASVQELVARALSAGGDDNISVMIVDVLEGRSPAWPA